MTDNNNGVLRIYDPNNPNSDEENNLTTESNKGHGNNNKNKNDPNIIKKINRTLNNILIMLIIAVILLAVIAIAFLYIALLIQSLKTDIYTSVDIKTLGANLDSTMSNMKSLSADPITSSIGPNAKDQLQLIVQTVSQLSISGQSEFNSTANRQLVKDVFDLLGRTTVYYNSTLNDFSNYEPKILNTVDKFLAGMTRFSQALGMMFVAPPPAPTP